MPEPNLESGRFEGPEKAIVAAGARKKLEEEKEFLFQYPDGTTGTAKSQMEKAELLERFREGTRH